MREAEGLAQAIGDDLRLGYVHAFLAHGLAMIGDYESALAEGSLALEIVQTNGTFELEAHTHFYVGHTM